jgi:hypothetical protein
MKKTEMSPGLEVEQKRGRDYPFFTTGIVILDTEPWDSVYRARDGQAPFQPATKYGPEYNCQRGIPCAQRHAVTDRDEGGEPITVGYVWKPTVFRSQELVPAGTEAAYRAEQQAVAERRDAIDTKRQDRLRELIRLSGVTGLRYATGWRNIDYSSVTLSIEEFEKLIDRLQPAVIIDDLAGIQQALVDGVIEKAGE